LPAGTEPGKLVWPGRSQDNRDGDLFDIEYPFLALADAGMRRRDWGGAVA